MNVCRVCLRSAGVYYKMYSVQEGLQLGEILKLCVPEVDLTLSKLPVLCETCMGLLSAAYTLRKTCLKTESQINEYLRLNKSNATPPTVVELKDIVQELYKNVEPPPPLIQRLGQPEGVPADFDKVLPKLTPIQPKSFMNVPNSASYLVQNTSSEASIMPVCVQAPLIVCGITNSSSDIKNSTSVVPALVLSPSKATQSIDTTVSSSTAKQGAPPKAKRTRAKRNTQEESSKIADPKSSFCTIGNVVSLHNEIEEKKEVDSGEKSETAKEGVNQPDSSKESSVHVEEPPKDDTNTAVEQTSTEESRNENSQEATNTVSSDDKAGDSDDVIITGFGNTEPVVITDDEDDDVQVVSETKLSNDVGSLLKNTPRIENMDVPELVSVTRVDPVNPVQQSSRGGNRRFFTGSGPSTVQGSNSNSAKNSSTEPKPIKVVNPKTNQVQIIGYILNPDSQAARKASSINSRQRSTSKPFSVTENKNTPNVSVSKPSTVTSVKSTPSVQSTENTLKLTNIKQESSVTDVNLSKKSDHILPDRGPDSEDEDNPDYVSVADLRPKNTNETSNESTVRVKREVPSDDEDSSTSHSAKKRKTSNDVPDTTSENPLQMVPFVKLEPIDASEFMKDPFEAVDPLSTIGQDSVDSPKVQDDSDPDYSPDILDLMPSPPDSPAADRPKRQNKPPARYSENPEEGKKRRRRSKKVQQPEDAATAAAPPAAETSTSTKKKGRPRKSDTQPTESEVETVIGQAGVYHFLSDFNLAGQPEPKKRGRKKKQANLEQETPSVGLFHSLFGDIAETLPAADMHGDLTNASSQYSGGIYGENLELDASMSNSENARLGMDENSEKNPIDTCQNSNIENDQVDVCQNSNLNNDQVDASQNSNLEIDPADSHSHTSISVGDENTQNVAFDGNSQIQSDHGDENTQNVAFDGNSQIQSDQDATADPLNNDDAVDDPLNNDSVSSNNMNRDEFVPSAENSVSNSISALSEDRKTSDEASEHCDKVDALAAVGVEEEEVVDVPEFVSLDALQGS